MPGTTACIRPDGQAIRTPADPVGAEQIPANMIGRFLDDPPEAAPDADQEGAAGKRKVGKQMTPPALPISRAESNVRLMSLIVIASAREGHCIDFDTLGPFIPGQNHELRNPGSREFEQQRRWENFKKICTWGEGLPLKVRKSSRSMLPLRSGKSASRQATDPAAAPGEPAEPRSGPLC
jgi:hypothetical protein